MTAPQVEQLEDSRALIYCLCDCMVQAGSSQLKKMMIAMIQATSMFVQIV